MVSSTSSPIKLTINGEVYEVGADVPPTVRLVQFIREWAKLTGTKSMCHEGGCGICSVVVTKHDFQTDSIKTFSVPSCQVLVYSCAGWAITTVEHLGNRSEGYHPIQKALAGFYGTQCGFCSPGFVMTMYGQMKSSSNLTMEEVEKSLDGNLCRCTGYRPILDAFKSLAVDAPKQLSNKLIDIEEISSSKCVKSGEPCTGSCSMSSGCGKRSQEDHEYTVEGVEWYRPSKIQSLAKILSQNNGQKKVRLVVGNTGQGVFKSDGPYDIYIDTNGIPELQEISTTTPITIGANVSLTTCIKTFHQACTNVQYEPLREIAKHWEFVANVGVRNLGSWVGNLAMKHQHHEFPSDIFLTLLVLGATVKVYDTSNDSTKDISVEDLLKQDLTNSFVISMTIPPQNGYQIRTYKITQRAVNSHAYVNAAFKFRCDSAFKVSEKPVLLFGGINPDFIHASKCEQFLMGRSLLESVTVQKAAAVLEQEIQPDNEPQDASPAYRKSLAIALLYKAILDIVGGEAAEEYRSGGPKLVRPLSCGKQTFDKNQDSWPIGQPMPKLESHLQVSGEAEYINDIPVQHGELHGAFVQTSVAKAKITKIDPTQALKLAGVVAFISEKDIPGSNSFVSADVYGIPEPLFVSTYSQYAGQAIGLIVAKRRDIALQAVKLMNIQYDAAQKPILTIQEAMKIKQNTQDPIVLDNIQGQPKAEPKHVIKGELNIGGQYHFYTETMCAIVVPKEGYDLWSSTQWVTETQSAVAEVLSIEANRLNFTLRRLGGAFGGKISRANVVTCAAAVAAHTLKKPVRIVLPLDVNMTLVGWREPYFSSYKVGFTEEGVLQSVDVDYIADTGVASNDVSIDTVCLIPGNYYSDTWNLKPKFVQSDTAANTWCRTPGFVEAVATMENIIEHVATYLNKEPSHIREINFCTSTRKNEAGVVPNGDNLTVTSIFPGLKKEALYDERRKAINEFNKDNRWVKRGISILPLLYVIDYLQEKFQVQVAIHAFDGTVAVCTGGVEMGQGLNTKVAQIAAKVLRIPVEKIKVKPTDNFVGANSSTTGGSLGSDLCGYGAKVACEKLRARLDVVADKMEKTDHKTPAWIPLIKKCLQEDVDLSERYWTATSEHPKGYDVFGSACVEVKVDVLTGQFMILRADIIEDCGRSLSPLIDVGQVEGSMVMAFGLYSSEMVKFNPVTGEKLSNGTWEYKIPSALDIPIDFRVSLLHKGDNPFGVVRSKATGEPAVCLGYSLVTALRDAIKSARADAGDDKWFDMDTPVTVEKIQQLCKVQSSDFEVSVVGTIPQMVKSNL